MQSNGHSGRGKYLGLVALGVLALGILAGLGYSEHRWGKGSSRTAEKQATLDQHRKLERRRAAIGVAAVAVTSSSSAAPAH